MNKIKLEFNCSQDYDKMPVTACGRYCEQCQKTVLDMSGKSVEEIRQLRREGKFCGVFDTEQVDDGYYLPEVRAGRQLRRLLATAAAFTGFALAPVHAQDKKPLPPTILTNPEKITRLPGDSSFMESSSDSAGVLTSPQAPLTRQTSKKQPKYYISWRFPFIHRQRPRRLMGCPKF